MKVQKSDYAFAILRISLGLTFLWAFLDKTFGLGFATTPERAWIAGGSPTSGFLLNATKGPLAAFYKSIAGIPAVDWLFMIGLLLIGLALIFGVLVKLAGYSGSLLMFLMWSAALLPENNPILDDHIIYIIALIGIILVNKTQVLGFGQKWQNCKLVKKNKWLE